MNTDLFQSCDHCWVFQIFWHIECSTFTASSFRIWNSSTGIPSPLLASFIVMLLKAHLTLHSRMSGSRWVITPSWLVLAYLPRVRKLSDSTFKTEQVSLSMSPSLAQASVPSVQARLLVLPPLPFFALNRLFSTWQPKKSLPSPAIPAHASLMHLEYICTPCLTHKVLHDWFLFYQGTVCLGLAQTVPFYFYCPGVIINGTTIYSKVCQAELKVNCSTYFCSSTSTIILLSITAQHTVLSLSWWIGHSNLFLWLGIQPTCTSA